MIVKLDAAIWNKDGSAEFVRHPGSCSEPPLHLLVRNADGTQILDLALWDGAEEVLFAAVDEYRAKTVRHISADPSSTKDKTVAVIATMLKDGKIQILPADDELKKQLQTADPKLWTQDAKPKDVE